MKMTETGFIHRMVISAFCEQKINCGVNSKKARLKKALKTDGAIKEKWRLINRHVSAEY